jgi:hypothetical protein
VDEGQRHLRRPDEEGRKLIATRGPRQTNSRAGSILI